MPDVDPLVRAEQWLTDPRWHDGVIAQIIRDLAQELRDLRAREKSAEVQIANLCDAHEAAFVRADTAEAHVEAQTVALHALAAGMRKKAKAMQRESEQPPTLVERQFYCDGKAMALRYAADLVDALSARPVPQESV